MKRLISFAWLFCAFTSLAWCNGISLDEEKCLEKGNGLFAMELYDEIGTQPGNIVVSPFNISKAIAMIYAGARGQTEKEIADALHFDIGPRKINHVFEQLATKLSSNTEDVYDLYLADSLWVQRNFAILPNFLFAFGQEKANLVHVADFVRKPEIMREAINTWVEQNTHHKIKDLLASGTIDGTTRLVLVSAMYLKAQWEHKFSSENTKEDVFYRNGHEHISKEMMTQTTRFPIFLGEDVSVLELPYRADDVELSMFVILPRDIDGLLSLENRLNETTFRDWISNVEMNKVSVTLPKFDITYSRQLNNDLQKMGMKTAFNADADFSAVTGNKDLFLSLVIHKATITVDEDGTEAAAATAGVMNMLSVYDPDEPVIFCANHPFLYAVVEKTTGTVLFMGRLTE